MGDFWSTAQKHNAQFLEHNGLMPRVVVTYGVVTIVYDMP